MDKTSDRQALPKVPAEFEVTLFASEPLVRQPCSMAFDERGRLFVGMGPQYRNPTPETPGDSVVIVLDSDGDGRADRIQEFATGFNAIQGLAWHGRDLWVANAPDLTVVKDLDGDDEADEYLKVYTDLGNLEHGLHGLNWAPDGKLYMSKGNSKGLNQPGRYAPKPFRDLWGLTAPADVPDFPTPVKSNKGSYRRAYHDPADDWGLDGGVLRCDDGGKNLEIVSRGSRNPWDINFDSGFNWIGTDNDQTTGDRVFMPFFGAHFGWNHPWSSHWGTEPHAPTAPVSGPLFEGSGTGVVFCQSPQFPAEYRGAFLVNDWLLKMTYLWRPQWDGALMRSAGGVFVPFIEGGSSLYRPTDMEFGPDGALWVLGWSSGYGAEWKDGQLTNEGRIYRIAWKQAVVDFTRSPAKNSAVVDFTRSPSENSAVVDFARSPAKPSVGIRNSGESHYRELAALSIDELLREFDSPLPVHRINAQDAVVQRGPNDKEVQSQLLRRLTNGKLSENQETWCVWSLGRMPSASNLPEFFHSILQENSEASLNLKVQSLRILAYRATQFGLTERLAESLRASIQHAEPRVRFAAVQAIHEAHQQGLLPELLAAIKNESDSTVFYAAWQALRALSSTSELRRLQSDSNAAVRRAAFLGLLETHAATEQEVQALAKTDSDPQVREVAGLWLTNNGKNEPRIQGRSLQAASDGAVAEAESPTAIATVRNTKVKNGAAYKVVPGGFRQNTPAYVDRGYRLKEVPQELEGSDLIQTANDDDNSRGRHWLSAEALVPVRVWVGIDARQKTAPSWLLEEFQKEPFMAMIDEGTRFVFYSRSFEAGRIELGGNTDDGRSGGKGNYIVAVAPLPLAKLPTKTTIDAVIPLMDRGDRDRGEWLFRHAQGASCAKCHSIDQSLNGFGPNLSSIGQRSNARHIIQSIVDPNAVITEGFNQLTVITDEGQVYSGVLLEESGLSLSLGQSNGDRVDIPKDSIEERKKSSVSAMPDMSELLTPQHVADLNAFLLSLQTQAMDLGKSGTSAANTLPFDRNGFLVEEQRDRLRFSLGGQPIVDFVFQDEKILRPYFANARLVNGVQVTRNHPPIAGEDAVDHDTMHPGIWLGFGDISGQDFWRNKAAMVHVRFVTPPTHKDGRMQFATECLLKSSEGDPLGRLTNEITLTARPRGWMLSWTATILADQRAIVFGDQEEMGFGARVSTRFTEKNGGLIRSSSGKQSANETWGQPAMWCDYSGPSFSGPGSSAGGIMLMADERNFRESWWHNRDYGVFVANPFGRESMKQGPKSLHEIGKGQTLQLRFGALIHDGQPIDFAREYKLFLDSE
ncbi:MAG: PmoA family protein [Pirellula sp.]|nr:PmoA family protein [Pirellula sp.]